MWWVTTWRDLGVLFINCVNQFASKNPPGARTSGLTSKPA
jgi:hypothetical protein